MLFQSGAFSADRVGTPCPLPNTPPASMKNLHTTLFGGGGCLSVWRFRHVGGRASSTAPAHGAGDGPKHPPARMCGLGRGAAEKAGAGESDHHRCPERPPFACDAHDAGPFATVGPSGSPDAVPPPPARTTRDCFDRPSRALRGAFYQPPPRNPTEYIAIALHTHTRRTCSRVGAACRRGAAFSSPVQRFWGLRGTWDCQAAGKRGISRAVLKNSFVNDSP